MLRGRQRDIHHRDVQNNHELRDADHAKVSRRRRSQTLLIEVASDMRFTLLPVS
jgi:hypothetical protein